MNLTFMNDEQKRVFEEQYKKIMIIGIAITASVFLYVFIAFLPLSTNSEAANIMQLRYTFLAIALFVAFAIRIIRSTIIRKVENPDFKNLINRLTVSSIITFSLCESIAILGFVEYFMTGIMMDLYIMIFLSLVFSVVHFPRKSHWEAYINQNLRGFSQ